MSIRRHRSHWLWIRSAATAYAFGSGNLRMTYDSANEDLRMFGTYTLTRGNYNFTLQDIIIKDFTIRDGSSITFHGDPYAAQLDIQAIYSLQRQPVGSRRIVSSGQGLNRTTCPYTRFSTWRDYTHPRHII